MTQPLQETQGSGNKLVTQQNDAGRKILIRIPCKTREKRLMSEDSFLSYFGSDF
jgi:hypothetical protein